MRRGIYVLLALSSVLLAGPLPGCGGDAPCTQLGCDSFLSLTLANPPAIPYRLEVVLPGGEIRTADCPNTGACTPATFVFNGVTAEEITVRVITAGGTGSGTARPAYITVEPNGHRCGPTCRQGNVTIQLLN